MPVPLLVPWLSPVAVELLPVARPRGCRVAPRRPAPWLSSCSPSPVAVARGCRPAPSPGPVARGCRPWLSPVAVARGCRPWLSPVAVARGCRPWLSAPRGCRVAPRGCRPAPWLSPGPVAVARPRRPSPVAVELLPVARRPSPVARRPSPVARRPSPVARRPSPVARRPSPVARRPWLSSCSPWLSPGPVAVARKFSFHFCFPGSILD